ncbi:hypothetical protein Tco_0973421 [Tanacetum coccineum]
MLNTGRKSNDDESDVDLRVGILKLMTLGSCGEDGDVYSYKKKAHGRSIGVFLDQSPIYPPGFTPAATTNEPCTNAENADNVNCSHQEGLFRLVNGYRACMDTKRSEVVNSLQEIEQTSQLMERSLKRLRLKWGIEGDEKLLVSFHGYVVNKRRSIIELSVGIMWLRIPNWGAIPLSCRLDPENSRWRTREIDFFNGHDSASRKASWIKWDFVLAPRKKKGGAQGSAKFRVAFKIGLNVQIGKMYTSWKCQVGRLNQRGSIYPGLSVFPLGFGCENKLFIKAKHGKGTRPEEVDAAATTMGCSIFTTPFIHLGVKVRGAMSRIKSWDDVVAKVSSRLSKWKLKTLSIGGRLTLIKSVLTSIPLYHISDAEVVRDFYTKFYNSLGSVPNRCSVV